MANSKQFKASIVLGGAVTGALRSAFGTVEGKLKRIGGEVQTLTQRQKLLGRSIKTLAGSGRNVDTLRTSYERVTQQLGRTRAAQMRLNSAQQRFNMLSGVGAKLRGAGVAVGIAGAAVAAPLLMGVKESKNFQTEAARIAALGLGDSTTKEAVKFATGMKTFGTSMVENLTLVRDAMSVFGHLDHAEMVAPMLAKMKFGNEAFYGKEKGAENETAFMDLLKVVELRGGLKSHAEFERQANMIQQVISATGGRVGADEWKQLIKTGGIAAKGTRDDAFYYQLEPLVQEMGGDKVGAGISAAYSSLYQGRTTKRAAMNLGKYGLIGDRSKVTHDKVGQIAHIDPGALKGSELFRQSQYEWLKQVLLPALAKKGMTSKDQVLDAIGSIVSNRRGADVLAAMYMQMQQIDKSEALNRGAYNVDQLNDLGKKSTTGKELQAEAKLADLKLRMGKDILPLYTRALELSTSALETLNGFMDKHPKIAKVMSTALAAVGASLLALAPLLLTVGYVLAPMAKGFGLVTTAVKFLGGAFFRLGLTLLSNPIFLIGAALAVAAYEIYKHWDGFKAFFSRLWGDVKSIFSSALDVIRDIVTGDFTRIIDDSKKLFVGFKTFIGDIFKGIGDGIETVLNDALDAMGLIDKKKLEQDKGKLAAANPADVDAAKAQLRKQGINPDASMWDNLFGGSAPALPAPVAVPPMATAGRGGSAAAPVHQSNVYHITQRPGEDGEALARRIAQHNKQAAAVATRGQLIDGVGAAH